MPKEFNESGPIRGSVVSTTRRYFRGVEWICEQGHANVHPTSFMRLSADRLACILDSMTRGAWCEQCNAKMIPAEIGRAVRVSEAKATTR